MVLEAPIVTSVTKLNAMKTHCLRGHEFTEENTFVFRGHRQCRACKRLSKKNRRARGGIGVKLEDRKASLWRNYKLRLDDVQAIERKQNYVCAICSKPPQRRSLDVDHDHATGAIRGLLCEHCNKGLGHFYDNPDLLILASNYLKQFKSI
jgi:hypothetical protein